MLMFSKIEKKYLKRCFDLALLGRQNNSPNPSVGAVVLYNEVIIGEGWSQGYGGAHAEVNAIASIPASKKQFLAESEIFVSLEPCFHFGKTPPCVDLILKENIKKVVIAFKDPNPKVAGQSVNKLLSNGIDVLFNTELKGDTNLSKINVAHPFFTNILQQRPYIILKWAETANGFIGKKNETLSISNELSKRLVHKWRSECDGIMVATNTAETDNPSLNNRFYFGKSPIRIVLDRTNRLSPKLNLFDNTLKTILYTDGASQADKKGENIEINQILFNINVLDTILKDLYTKKIAILLVEGGAALLNSFIEKGLWDEARVIKSAAEIAAQDAIKAPKIDISYLHKSVKLDNNTVTFYKNN
jgi:diaminohydroxyphosphoribosylaminopyrimidine deaminase / 5-amino-6-(5-phosphoribosylamino)uracil reductase